MKSKLQSKVGLFTISVLYAVTTGICTVNFIYGLIRLMLESSVGRYDLNDGYKIETRALFWGSLLVLIAVLIVYSIVRKMLIYNLENSADEIDSSIQNSSQTVFTDSYWDCPNCGTTMNKKDIYCHKCGTSKFKQPSENEWKCPKCGKINQNYVGTCGCGEVKK